METWAVSSEDSSQRDPADCHHVKMVPKVARSSNLAGKARALGYFSHLPVGDRKYFGKLSKVLNNP